MCQWHVYNIKHENSSRRVKSRTNKYAALAVLFRGSLHTLGEMFFFQLLTSAAGVCLFKVKLKKEKNKEVWLIFFSFSEQCIHTLRDTSWRQNTGNAQIYTQPQTNCCICLRIKRNKSVIIDTGSSGSRCG